MKIKKIEIYDNVSHRDVYHGMEEFIVVGIRVNPNEFELEGDWSGGTHNVRQRGWMKADGIILNKKYGKSK